MSSIIYIANDGDDLSPEQLELLHKYNDQARVWAHLLFKEAGFYPKPYATTEEWLAAREQWHAAKAHLKKLDPAYHDYVVSTDPRDPGILIEPYVLTQKDRKHDRMFDAADVDSPAFPEEQFGHSWGRSLMSYEEWLKTHPAEKTPEQIKEVNDTTRVVQELLGRLYSRGMHPSSPTPGPTTTTEEQTALLKDPQTAEEFEQYLKDSFHYDFSRAPKAESASLPTALHQMAAGFAATRGHPDPEEFAQSVIARALRLYNPHASEDLGVGYLDTYCTQCNDYVPKSELSKHEGHTLSKKPRKARFGTYLYRAMVNAINTMKTKQVKEVSLSEGRGEEDAGDTLEERLAEKLKQAGFDFSDPDLLFQLDEYLKDYTTRPGSKFTPESAARLKKIYEMHFIDGDSYSDIARNLGLVTRNRSRELKEMARRGIDTSSLPVRSPLPDDRKRTELWANYFKVPAESLSDILKQLEAQASAGAPDAEKKLQDAQNLFKAIMSPNAQRVYELVTGEHPGKPGTYAGAHLFEFLRTLEDEDVDEFLAAWAKRPKRGRKAAILEDFLNSISSLRKEGTLNYNLLRNKIEQCLSAESPQLFTVYTYLYESDYSNPDTAKIMKLSPPRITGLKKKIISTLLELPEIENILSEAEEGSVSPLRRLIFACGDSVKVLSINETGILTSTDKEGWYEVRLDNGNDVLTVKNDLQKHCTLIDSAYNVLGHYYSREVVTPQCYLSLVASSSPKLAILELRPVSEEKTAVRLHINNNLVDVTEITERYPDNLISILKGHIGISASIDTPFTALFEEVDGKANI